MNDKMLTVQPAHILWEASSPSQPAARGTNARGFVYIPSIFVYCIKAANCWDAVPVHRFIVLSQSLSEYVLIL